MYRRYPLRFDWAIVFLSALLLGGAYLDNWAHAHVPEFESFFSPWHIPLYGSFLALAVFLSATAINNMRQRGTRVIPRGYELSLLGVGLFVVGAVADAVWHSLFGIERGLGAAVSPSHVVLVFASTLIAGGPLRAAWQRARAHGWTELGPVVVSVAFLLAGVTYLTGYANPFVHPWASSGFRAAVAANTVLSSAGDFTIVPLEVGEMLGVLGVLTHTAMVMGLLLPVVWRWQLPPGSLLVIFTIGGLVRSVPHDTHWLVPAMVFGGVVAEVLAAVLRPKAPRRAQLRIFATLVPIGLYASYFGFLASTAGVEWTAHVLVGSVGLAGLVGWGLSHLLLPPPLPSD
jgi:hypothetical protein